jgi:glycosyltransferase involved in cell wall biosynthesis
LYFHGHTVGGTNPSLLEAMACGSVVCAHHNVFNRSILQGNGIYFENPEEVSVVMSSEISQERRLEIQNGNRQQVADHFGWDKIANEYLRLFEDAML